MYSVSTVETGVMYLQYNDGQLGDSTKRRDLNVEPAWIQGITGRGVTVAIVDDGTMHYSYCYGISRLS